MTTKETTIDLGTIDCSKAKAIYVAGMSETSKPDEWWMYHIDPEQRKTMHCPEDRCGGPYGLFAVVNPDDCGERWFIFAVVDSYFPIRELVRADSFEDAYEIYVDHAAEHWHLKIEPDDLKDYCENGKEYEGSYTSNGEPVDTDSIHGNEVRLMRIDF